MPYLRLESWSCWNSNWTSFSFVAFEMAMSLYLRLKQFLLPSLSCVKSIRSLFMWYQPQFQPLVDWSIDPEFI